MRSLWYKAFVATLFCLIAQNFIATSIKYAELQWDLDLFLDTAIAYQNGANPYHPANVYAVHPTRETQTLPWLYPPHHLIFFRLLCSLDRSHAKLLWYCAKICAGLFLLIFWWRTWGQKAGMAIFLLCFHFAFRNPLLTDFMSGNFSTFEQFFLWIGVLSLLSNKNNLFTILTFISASWKWTLSIFIVATGFNQKKSKMIISIVITLGLIGLQNSLWLVSPWSTFFTSYIQLLSSNRISEWQSLSWDGNHFSVLYGLIYLFQSTQVGFFIWVGLSLLIGLYSFLSIQPYIWKQNNRATLLRLFCFLTLIYSALMPRYKSYNALILIPALLEGWMIVKSNPPRRTLFLIVLFSISWSGVITERKDLLAQIYNLRFTAAMLIFWGIYATHFLPLTFLPSRCRTLIQCLSKLLSSKNTAPQAPVS